jgi:hypothetical protein
MSQFAPLPSVTSRCQTDFGNVFPLPITTLPVGYQKFLATGFSLQIIETNHEICLTSVAKPLRCQPANYSMISTVSTFPPPPKGGGVFLVTHTPPTRDRWAITNPLPKPIHQQTYFHGDPI